MSRKLTTIEFIEKSVKKHGNKYDYSLVNYINNATKINIICLIHGEFLQTPRDHLTGYGCMKCGGKEKLTTNDFIKKSILIHGNKYDYSKSVYVNNKIKIVIICPVHGEFKQKTNDHCKGHGCSKCGDSEKSNTKEFVEKSIKIHGNLYDYDKVEYSNASTKIKIICNKHGEFLQKPLNHLSGQGCPKCRLSKGEIKIHKFLQNNNIEYIPQKTFDDCKNPKTNKKLKYDFYIPSKKLLIEFDGPQHFKVGKIGKHFMTKKELKHIQYLDMIKTNYTILTNMKLIRIKYIDSERIDEILYNII